MIRAIRFGEKLNAELSNEIQDCIMEQAPLLSYISPARLYEECIKLFQNEYSLQKVITHSKSWMSQ
jgi:poly(A) polymerase